MMPADSPVLVTTKFDEDPLKNKRASLETPFSYYNSMGKFLDANVRLLMTEILPSGVKIRFDQLSNNFLIASIFTL